MSNVTITARDLENERGGFVQIKVRDLDTNETLGYRYHSFSAPVTEEEAAAVVANLALELEEDLERDARIWERAAEIYEGDQKRKQSRPAEGLAARLRSGDGKGRGW